MIDVENKIRIYEINDEEVDWNENHKLTIRSHWNRNEMVVLELDGKKIGVVARDLEAAIQNAKNVNRF